MSSEATKLHAEIAEAKTKVKGLTREIKHREGRLRRIAADAFNEAREPLDDMTAEVREIVLGTKPCELSPIDVCVYKGVSQQWNPWNPTYTDACLFCGKPGKSEKAP